MEQLRIGFNSFSSELTTAAVSVLAAVLAYIAFVNIRAARYAGISYEVPIPHECSLGWEGKQLENPSIKVISSRHTAFEQ